MQRVKRSTAVAVQPAPPAGGTPGYFALPNPQGGIPATVPGFEWYNNVQEELVGLVLAAGLALADNDPTQLVQAIIKKGLQGSYFNIGAAGGTADAITATYTPAIAAVSNGMTLYVRAAAANATTTPTFTPNSGSIAAKPIVKGAGAALAAGDIAGGGHWIELQYNLTLDKWVLLNPATGIASNGNAFRKNAIINGNFDIWQRNTSFALTTAGSNYASDRWLANIGTSGNNSTISRQAFTLGQGVVPNEPTYWLRYAVTAFVSGVPSLEQRIEGVRTYAGRQVTVSFWAKADAARTVTGQLTQVFGTGGSPSGSVGTSLGSFALTTSWQQFTALVSVPSISGKTLGTNGDDYLQLLFVMPGAVCTIDFSQVQVEASSSATAFELLPPQQVLALCQRYYEKSYPQSIYANAASGVTDGATFVGVTTSDAVGNNTFKVTKRATPTVAIYAPPGASGAGSVRNDTATSVLTGFTAADISEYGINRINKTSGVAASNVYSAHFTADAEL